MRDPRSEYAHRLAERRERVAELDRQHLWFSNARLVIFAAIALLGYLAFIRGTVSSWWVVVAGVGFGAVAVAHAKLLNRAERARRAARGYERGIERVEDRWAGTGRGGDHFLEGHPYARDLDLFGRASLFELLNTARTEAGEAALADWLRSGAAADEIKARQIGVEELRAKLDYREDVAVLAAEGHVSRTGALASWASSPPIGIGRGVMLLFVAIAAVTIAFGVLAYEGVFPWRGLVFCVVAGTALTLKWRRTLHHVAHRVGQPVDDLTLLADLFARVEREPASSPRLSALKAALSTGGVVSSRAIARLRQTFSWYESSTHNLLFMPFTRALFVPELLSIAIDRWHATYGGAVPGWLTVIGELEALIALSTYAYEHPADPLPVLVADGPVFEAEALGHPLIADAASVRNDVHVGGNGPRVIVISGSNMSGKSTLLRSVGVNIVLAMAGAPVRAARLRLAPLALGATLRIDDSLQAGQSKFYAEILRIRGIVEAASGEAPLLFLLDEILHGTNSYDRRIGAEAIVRTLVDAGAIGFVTTHDLALTELPQRLGAAAVNMHFADRIEDGRMVFDYRMRPGVVEHSNALALMRAVGLNV
jgi:hypothetical protein